MFDIPIVFFFNVIPDFGCNTHRMLKISRKKNVHVQCTFKYEIIIKLQCTTTFADETVAAIFS